MKNTTPSTPAPALADGHYVWTADRTSHLSPAMTWRATVSGGTVTAWEVLSLYTGEYEHAQGHTPSEHPAHYAATLGELLSAARDFPGRAPRVEFTPAPVTPDPAPALAPGVYTVTAGYTSQVWHVTAQGVERTTAQSGPYSPSPLAPLTHAEAAQVLAQAAAYLGRPAAQPLAPQPVSTPSAAPVGRASARALHVELSRLGYREHYAAASDALGRPVSSLAALTAAELKTVYAYAYGSLGMTA